MPPTPPPATPNATRRQISGAIAESGSTNETAPDSIASRGVLKNCELASSLFKMELSGHVYSRISNPNNAVL